MQTGETNCVENLEPGQLWRLENGYVFIVERGRRLVHYKMLREPTQRAAMTRLIGIEPLLKYLAHSDAELMRSI
jgi:hypothetical protein